MLLMHYKGYPGSVEPTDSEVIHGKLLGITDLVTYEADSMADLWKAFIGAVDDYLKTCKELARDPQKPGAFRA